MNDLHDDPRTGDLLSSDPLEASLVASKMTGAAHDAIDSANAVTEAESTISWNSPAAGDFRQSVHGVSGELTTLSDAFAVVSHAFSQYYGQLSEIRPKFVGVLSELQDDQQRLADLQSTLIDAEHDQMRGYGNGIAAEQAVITARLAVDECQEEIARLTDFGLRLLGEFESERRHCLCAVESQFTGPTITRGQPSRSGGSGSTTIG